MSKAKLIIVASLIVIAVMLVLTFRRGRQAPELETAPVSRGNLAVSVFASGELKSAGQVNVFAKTSGTVWSLSVEDGQTVSEGQQLLQLDTTSAQALVAQKESALKTVLNKKRALEDSKYTGTDLRVAEALVNEKRTAWVRAEEDYNEDKDNEDKKAARDTAYTAYQQAEKSLEGLKNSNPTEGDWRAIEAEITSTEKSLAEAQLALSHTTIIAPQSGTLIFVDSGISSASVITSGQKLFLVANFEEVIFEIQIDETDVRKVSVGQKVVVGLDAYPDTDFVGKIAKIDEVVGTDSSGDSAVKAEVLLERVGQETKLRLGFSGEAEIIQEERLDVLLLPAEALVAELGKSFVHVVGRDEEIVKREVGLGLENDDVFEVVSGIREGEEVVIGGLETVKRGGK